MLLERDQLGSGSTSKAAGGFRAQFSDALNIEIAKRSLAAYKAFEQPARAGRSTCTRSATSSCSPREADVDAFTRSVALQNELGVPVADDHAGRGARALPAARGRRHAGRELLARGRPRDARGRRPGLRVRRAQPRRAPRRRAATVDADRRRATTRSRPSHAGDGTVTHRHGDLRRRRLVARAAASWPASSSPSRRCAARCSSPSRWPTCRGTLPLTIDFAIDLLLPPRGPRAADGHGRPERDAGLRHRDDRRLDPRRCSTIAERRAPRLATRRHPGRLGGPLRHEPGPQRDHRRGRSASRASSTPPASPATASCRGRRPASCCATSCSAPPFVDIAPLSVERFDGADARARVQHRLMPLRTRGPAPSNVDLAARGAARRDRRRPAASPGERIKEIPLAEQLGFSRGADPRRAAAARTRRPGRADPQPRRRRPRGARARRARGLRAARLARLARAAEADARAAASRSEALERAARAPARARSSAAARARPPTPTSPTRRRSSPPSGLPRVHARVRAPDLAGADLHRPRSRSTLRGQARRASSPRSRRCTRRSPPATPARPKRCGGRSSSAGSATSSSCCRRRSTTRCGPRCTRRGA